MATPAAYAVDPIDVETVGPGAAPNAFKVEFYGVEEVQGGYKWNYKVTVTVPDGVPDDEVKDLSHWELYFCLDEDEVQGASHSAWEVLKGGQGFKWEVEVKKNGQPVDFWFILKSARAVEDVQFGIKAGTPTYTGFIMGPSCNPPDEPEEPEEPEEPGEPEEPEQPGDPTGKVIIYKKHQQLAPRRRHLRDLPCRYPLRGGWR